MCVRICNEYAKNTEDAALVQRKIFNFCIFALILFFSVAFRSLLNGGFFLCSKVSAILYK
jgi:hypothetical protein